MRVNHIGLPVREEARSLAFYATYLGFDPATARRYPDGTVIVRNADGFDLALHPGDVPTGGETFLHFGFSASEPDAVRELMARMRADGVSIVEHDEEPDSSRSSASTRTAGASRSTGSPSEPDAARFAQMHAYLFVSADAAPGRPGRP
jgi:catechol 2,3-dioxygenase-like lactoylglutathione lyase family enzyme